MIDHVQGAILIERSNNMSKHGWLGVVMGMLIAFGTVFVVRGDELQEKGKPKVWRGVHLQSIGPDGLPLLKQALTEALAPMGVNVVVIEMNYRFPYKSHPELGDAKALSVADARDLSAHCRALGIRLIPQFNCLGHQSWSRTTFALLKNNPDMDETPDAPADNKGLYCRSWCPLHPSVNEVAFDLMDELIDAFQADALHVGMDEVFEIASQQCPRCRGKDPAELFAKAVNDYHHHLVDEKHVTMLMWGDRLLDDKAMHYGKWESSANGTASAIDRIPKDIIMCDWHYEVRKSYPSVQFFEEKGFRVWPSSWNDEQASLALMDAAQQGATDKMIGHLCTTWSAAAGICRALLNQPTEPAPKGRGPESVVAAMRACMARLARESKE
jgi:hypothetical protein